MISNFVRCDGEKILKENVNKSKGLVFKRDGLHQFNVIFSA